jgi:hypothetical protein
MQTPVHQVWFDLSTFGTTLSHEILKMLTSNRTKIIREAFSRSNNQESPYLIWNQMDNYSADNTPSLGTRVPNQLNPVQLKIDVYIITPAENASPKFYSSSRFKS